MNIINQLMNIYYNKETWHRSKLPIQEAYKYFNSIIHKGRLLYYAIDGNIVGYVEWYNVSYEQFKRLINNDVFHIDDENITDGNICYITNTWIDEKYRNSDTVAILKHMLFNANRDCEYFAGQEVKHNRRLAIFKKRG